MRQLTPYKAKVYLYFMYLLPVNVSAGFLVIVHHVIRNDYFGSLHVCFSFRNIISIAVLIVFVDRS